jgi:citrate lyase subunit beta/citryl-CoA lyase
MLFVPGDSEKKLKGAPASGADALIIDLEDSVAAARRPVARQLARGYAAAGSSCELWLRINPLMSGEAAADLRDGFGPGFSGVVLPKAGGARELRQLDLMLTRAEAAHGMACGATRVLPIATETPASVFTLQEYVGASPRLAGLTWGAVDLAAAVGASANRDDAGNWLSPYAMARGLCLFAAAAAAVTPVETVFTDFRDDAALERTVAAARRDGFRAMMAIHPRQVPIINSLLTPSPAEVDRAERVLRLFEAHPGEGVLSLDGEMLDRPHLRQAESIIAAARRDG